MPLTEQEIQIMLSAKFCVGQRVEKFTGGYTTFGTVRTWYVTSKGLLRYVIEVEPQGFQMIWSEDQLREVI